MPLTQVAVLDDLRRLPPAGDAALAFAAASLAAGDGGGGWFKWDAASREADDGGCVVAVESRSVGRWLRVYSGAADVRWFGARGDGVADDTAAIQRAIDHHADVHFPAGVYRLTRPIDVRESWGRRLSGAGQTANPGAPGGFDNGRLSLASTLLLDADDAPVLRLAGSGNLVERLCLMSKTRQPRDAANSYGIELNAFSRSRLSDLRIFNCATGIGLPQRAVKRGKNSNWMFDSALSNIDINNFSRCGLDLRNYQGGGTGNVLSQIYMANFASGEQPNPEVYETDHFIRGHNWWEYVLQGVHCEWARCRGAALELHNCNAAISGLHMEGVRFAGEVDSVVRLEGGATGLTLDGAQLYQCRLEGGPASAPLALVSTHSARSRATVRNLYLSRTTTSLGGRKFTPARIQGGDARIEVSGMMIEPSSVYVAPAPAAGLTLRE
ncbi:MAG: glycosyl hydrolase family 28-related protein [Alphaproteobacteria bacterium]